MLENEDALRVADISLPLKDTTETERKVDDAFRDRVERVSHRTSSNVSIILKGNA